jgi:hypothetical protein
MHPTLVAQPFHHDGYALRPSLDNLRTGKMARCPVTNASNIFLRCQSGIPRKSFPPSSNRSNTM